MTESKTSLINKIIEKSAQDLVNVANVKKGENVLIYFDFFEMAHKLAAQIADLATQRGARVWYRLRDLHIEKQIFTNSNRHNLERFYAFLNLEFMEADTIFMIRALEDPFIFEDVPAEKMAIVNKAQRPI